MDADFIAQGIQLIGSVGFPIVACVGLFYLYNKTITEITNTLVNINVTLTQVSEAVKTLTSKMSDIEKQED